MKKNTIKGSLILLIAAVIWGLSFVAQTDSVGKITTLYLNSARSLVGAAFLFLFILARDGINRKRNRENPKTDRKKLLLGGSICGVCLTVAANLQQLGISLYPEGAAASGRTGFITVMYVVLVPILGLFMKKKPGKSIIVGVAMTLAGMYLLCIKGTESFSIYTGDLVVMACALAFSFQIMSIDRFVSVLDPVKLSCVQFTVCGILSGILAFIFETPTLGALYDAAFPILFLGIMSSGIAYTFQMVGQKLSGNPALASIIMSLESVFAVIGGAIILSEKMTVRELIGCAVIFAAVVITELSQIKKERPSK